MPKFPPPRACDCCGEPFSDNSRVSTFAHADPTHPGDPITWCLCASCAQSVSDHLTELCYEEADEDEDSDDDFGFDPSYPLADDYDDD